MVNEDSGEVRKEEPRLVEPEFIMDRDILSMLIRENNDDISKLIFPIIKRWVIGNQGNVTEDEYKLCMFFNDLIKAREDDKRG